MWLSWPRILGLIVRYIVFPVCPVRALPSGAAPTRHVGTIRHELRSKRAQWRRLHDGVSAMTNRAPGQYARSLMELDGLRRAIEALSFELAVATPVCWVAIHAYRTRQDTLIPISYLADLSPMMFGPFHFYWSARTSELVVRNDRGLWGRCCIGGQISTNDFLCSVFATEADARRWMEVHRQFAFAF